MPISDLKQLQKEELKNYKLLGTATGYSLGFCLWTASNHTDSFFEIVYGYYIHGVDKMATMLNEASKLPGISKDCRSNFSVSFYEEKSLKTIDQRFFEDYKNAIKHPYLIGREIVADYGVQSIFGKNNLQENIKFYSRKEINTKIDLEGENIVWMTHGTHMPVSPAHHKENKKLLPKIKYILMALTQGPSLNGGYAGIQLLKSDTKDVTVALFLNNKIFDQEIM